MFEQAQTTGLEAAFRRTWRAGPGSTIEVVDRAGRTTIYELEMPPLGPAPKEVTVDSEEGIALLGARTGDEVAIEAGNGRRRRVRVVEVTPPAPPRDTDPAVT